MWVVGVRSDPDHALGCGRRQARLRPEATITLPDQATTVGRVVQYTIISIVHRTILNLPACLTNVSCSGTILIRRQISEGCCQKHARSNERRARPQRGQAKTLHGTLRKHTRIQADTHPLPLHRQPTAVRFAHFLHLAYPLPSLGE